MEWFLNLNFFEMVLYIAKLAAAAIVVIAIFALIFWALELLLGVFLDIVKRD